MIPLIGSAVTVFIIIWLFRLDRGTLKVTGTIWVPYAWLLIASTRPISNWLSLSQPVGEGGAYVEGSPLDRTILTSLLVAGVIALSRRKQVSAILREHFTIHLYFGYCLLSILWCDYPEVLFKRWFRGVGDIVLILLVVTEPNWMDALKWLFTRLSYVLVPLSILFIRFYPSLGRFYSRGGVPEWTGVCTDKNALGMLCMIYGAALLWCAVNVHRGPRNRQRKRILRGIIVTYIMILYLMWVIDSKTALACFVMSDVIILATCFTRVFRRALPVTLLIIGMVAVCVSVLFLGVGGGALEAIGRNPSLTGRTDVWKTVLPYAKSFWLGAGYENFWVGERMGLFNRLLGGLNQAHNGYIETYLNLGCIGLVLLGLILLTGYTKIIKGLRNPTEIAGLKLAFFFIAVVYNFTEATFKMQAPVWLFLLWAIMAPYPRRSAKQEAGLVADPGDIVSDVLVAPATSLVHL